MKLEQQNNKMARENLLHKIVRAEISGTHRKQSKIQNKKSYYEICWANKFGKNWYNHVSLLCAEFRLFETSTVYPAWSVYVTSLSVNASKET